MTALVHECCHGVLRRDFRDDLDARVPAVGSLSGHIDKGIDELLLRRAFEVLDEGGGPLVPFPPGGVHQAQGERATGGPVDGPVQCVEAGTGAVDSHDQG